MHMKSSKLLSQEVSFIGNMLCFSFILSTSFTPQDIFTFLLIAASQFLNLE